MKSLSLWLLGAALFGFVFTYFGPTHRNFSSNVVAESEYKDIDKSINDGILNHRVTYTYIYYTDDLDYIILRHNIDKVRVNKIYINASITHYVDIVNMYTVSKFPALIVTSNVNGTATIHKFIGVEDINNYLLHNQIKDEALMNQENK